MATAVAAARPGVFTRHADVLLAGGILGIVALMLIPLPTALLDVLLTFNISFSVMIVLVTLYTRQPLEFSVFPTVLLVATLMRLGLNVASTRLILLNAYAGRVIEAFGSFVVGGNYVVGFVIFLIIVVIQFVVITKGAGRIAEVAARFTLDAMPGKQMAIDADLNAGLIDEREARARREEIRREADFYGAMDGASKFVRGDAIAGIIITLINVIGGFIIGKTQHGMSLSQAAQTFTILAIGDGLVSQIPALLVSTAAGMMVTRAAGKMSLGRDLFSQILGHPRAVAVAAVMLFFLGIVPGLPKVPFFLMSAAAWVLYRTLAEAERREQREAATAAARPGKPEKAKKGPETVEELLSVDPMELEIGYGLIPLVDASQGGDLLDRISAVRRQCAAEMGIVVPPIRIRDNVRLAPSRYVVKVGGVQVAEGEVMADHLLAMNPGNARGRIPGVPTKEPAFGLDAVWIAKGQRERAEAAGYTVVTPAAVVATHLTEVVKNFASELVGRQEVQNLIDNVRKTSPAVVDELIPNLLSLGEVQKVIHNLLAERVSVRNLVKILEALADYAPLTRDVGELTEYVRRRLARQLTEQYASEDGKLRVLTLSPELEEAIASAVAQTGSPSLEPRLIHALYGSLSEAVRRCAEIGERPIVMCSPQVRRHFRALVANSLPNLTVLSYSEVVPGTEVVSLGTVKVDEAAAVHG